MIEVTVNCDGCAGKVNEPTQCDRYYLRLSQGSAPHKRGYPTIDIYIHPMLDEDKHFCGFKCLQNWINRKFVTDSK